MSSAKTILGTLYRLFNNARNFRAPILRRRELNTGKKDESKTLLSSDTRPTTLPTVKDIPGPKPSIPLIGTGWQYFPGGRYNLENLHEAANDKYMRYGPIVKEEFQWGKPVVQLYDPDDFRSVFQYQGPTPIRPISEFVKHYRLSHPDKYDTIGLANSTGEEWRRLRKLLGDSLLKLNALDGHIGNMNAIGDDFVSLLRNLRDPKTFVIENFQNPAYRVSLESVYMMSLDSRLGCLNPILRGEPTTMINSVQLLFEAFQELYYGPAFWKIYPTASYKKLHIAESLMYDAASKGIEEKMEYLRHCPHKTKGQLSILETLLKTEDLTDKARKVTIIDFLSGGIFTISNATSFLMHHIAENPEVQEKLYREIKEHLPNGDISKEFLRMPYLQACIKESFRLTPTIPCISRILSQDMVLSNYNIPAGTPVFCNFMVACKQADRFPDPERFNPDRWINKTSRTSAFAVLPFGHGHRSCVGQRFAELEMATMVTKTVFNFEMISTGQKIKCKQAFIVVPSHPVSIILKDRK